ncbi:MAG TPA: FAD binding domain-containing protein [Tepidisphaeraceae bacterium]|jgi:xanthine dehydrogenase small subunit
MPTRDHIVLFINGQRHTVRGDTAWMTLTDYLRLTLRLTGTKIVCAEGDCGSCTISLGRPRGDAVDYTTVCGCILRLYQLDAAHVVTIEGFAYDGNLNPVQSAMVQCHGSQCGFCTPGFVVTLHQLLQDGKKTDADVRRKLTGNLCRCTGYDAILDAAKQCDVSTIRPVNRLYPDATLLPALTALAADAVRIDQADRTFYKPTRVADAVAFRAAHPTSVVIAGGTDLGVVMNKRKIDPAVLMSTAALPNFTDVTVHADHIAVGGGASHDAVQRALAETIPEYFDYLEWFGSPQVRQAGTLAGNLATGSPIGDSLPPLCVLNASIELTGPNGTRLVSLNDFYTGYRTSVMKSDELITRVLIPIPAKDDVLKLYKISKRRDLDISTFSAAVWMRRREGVIEETRIAFGGVGPTVLRLRKTEAFLRGRPFTEETFDDAGPIVLDEITPISDVRGSADYRNLLGENILRRMHAELTPAAHAGNGRAR